MTMKLPPWHRLNPGAYTNAVLGFIICERTGWWWYRREGGKYGPYRDAARCKRFVRKWNTMYVEARVQVFEARTDE